ncbi:DUF3139 domain-containing protein [Bacillus sp. 1P06AnD]|uniref:DUF3139 domain-containing protein n=1 Tax=Bacillus sp. 1P06AnD TaxID=3132208 RepID=UPI0039A3D17C
MAGAPKVDYKVKAAIGLFAILGLCIIGAIGYIFFLKTGLWLERMELKRETMSHLLKSYKKEEIEEIQIVNRGKGLGPYEAAVVFKDEPDHIYIYIEDSGVITQQYNSSPFIEGYKHTE